MGKCRDALSAEEGDLERAVEWLKKRGVRSMEKRANEAAEALLATSVAADASAAAFVEVRAETDFVTRNEIFQQLCVYLANLASQRRPSGGVQEFLEQDIGDSPGRPKQVSPGTALGPALLELGSLLGERLVLGGVDSVAAPEGGVVGAYVHPKFSDGAANTGRMAALVALRPVPAAAASEERLRTIAAHLARHVVAAQPRFVSVASVPADVLQKERDTFWAAHLEQMPPRNKGTVDDKVKAKVLDGKTQKFYSETVLLCQELIGAPQATGAKGDPKPVAVAEWLEQEARAMGLEQIAVEEFRFSSL